MNAPAISVLMPVYNAEHYIDLAIDSVLNQTFSDFELIAIDDGSVDSSREILEERARRDIRIRCCFRPNTGIGGALNDGIKVARGEFLARMDADDIALPQRFAQQIARFKSDSTIVALGSAVIFMDSSGHLVKSCPRSDRHEQIEQSLLQGDGGAIIHPSLMMRRESVTQIGGYRTDRYYEDLDLYLRLARVGQLTNLSEPLLKYRIHPTSVNFSKFLGRHELRMRILQAAHEARGLPFTPLPLPTESKVGRHSFAGHYRDWSASSLEFGSRHVAIKHGLNACLAEPLHPESWKALKYAMTAPIPHSAVEPAGTGGRLNLISRPQI